jgi:hypothetical protein
MAIHDMRMAGADVFSVERKSMKHQNRSPHAINENPIKLPAYPFTGQILLADLRTRLSAQLGEQMSFERLSRIIGKSKSTTHHWFNVFPQPHLLAFMGLLEQLSPAQRHSYIDSHCRIFPNFDHPWLAHSPANIDLLLDVTNQRKGLTIMTGGTELSRTFLMHAIGHSYRRSHRQSPGAVGLELHRPDHFVPVDSFLYVDGTVGVNNVPQLVLKGWPRILTSSATLICLNGLWSLLPAIRHDIVRCATKRHVVLAEAKIPNVKDLEKAQPHRTLHISELEPFPGRIRIDPRRWK